MFHPKFARRPVFRMTEGPDGSSGSGFGSPGPSSLPAGDGTPGLEGTAATSAPPPSNPWDTVPRSWKQEYAPLWQKTDAEVRRIIHQREQDVEKGIRTYAEGHGRYSKLRQVFEPVLQQNPDLDLDGVYSTLAQNHLALVQADPESRRELFLQMAQHYGVDFANAAAAGNGQPGEGLTPAQRRELSKMIEPLQGFVQSELQTRQAQTQAEMRKSVDAFFSDPKNKYVNDVGPVMAKIIQSGQTSDLGEAYELAILRSPEVRAKYIADMAGASAPAPQAGGIGNVKSSAAPASPGKPSSIDETMDAVLAKHGMKR